MIDAKLIQELREQTGAGIMDVKNALVETGGDKEKALESLRCYHWPGNVRELENVIKRLMVMTEGNLIDVTDLPSLMRFSVPRIPDLTRTLAETEVDYIRNVLVSVGGNKTQAAKILGISRATLRDKLKES